MKNAKKKTARESLKDFFAHRQHPIKIFGYTTKYFYLLLIPLAKYLIAVKFDINSWLRDRWVDILTLLVIFAYATIRWACVSFSYEKNFLIAKTGFFGIKRTKIYFNKITSASLEESLFMRLIKSCRICVDTPAGGDKNSDLNLVLSKKNAELLFNAISIHSKKHSCPYPKTQYKQRKIYMLIFSLLFSSTLSGAILFASLFYKASNYLGQSLENKLLEQFSTITSMLSKYVPTAVMTIAVFIGGGWIISFVTNLLNNWNFTCFRRGKSITITGGILSKRKHFINVQKINYTDMQQSLLMKIFKICSVRIHCPGFGKKRSEIDALIPISTMEDVKNTMKLLLFNSQSSYTKLAPSKNQTKRFIFLPIVLLIVLTIISVLRKLLLSKFTNINNILLYLMVVLFIPAVWLLIVKATSVYYTDIGYNEGRIRIRYNYIYTFHTIETDVERITKAEITQNIFQEKDNVCTLKIYTRAENNKIHFIRFLDLKKTEDFLKNSGLWEL